MNHKSTLTADQVRQKFRERGITFTQWAEKNGYDRKAVYRVLSGTDKAHFGRAHEIAVALGMKPSISDTDSNPQKRAAA